MSSAAPAKPMSPAPSRPAAPPTGGLVGGGPVIDPIKILKKWKYVLAAAVVVGFFAGVGGHFLWAFTYPFYNSVVTYETKPPETADLMEATDVDEEALERFMATQADRMLSPIILDRVSRDPRLQQEAPEWSASFVQPDGTFDYKEAMKELEKRASASPVKGTNYIRLNVMWKRPQDAAGIAQLLSDAYMTDLRQSRGLESNERRDAIQRSINDIKQEIDNLSERRGRLIRDEEVTGIVEQSTSTREKLSLIARERNIIALEMRKLEVQLSQMNKMVESEGGIRYSDTQRAMAENSPMVMRQKQTKDLLDTRLKELRRSGFLPGHREYKRIETQMLATEQQISVTMERELAKLFDAEKDSYEAQLRQFQAQEADMVGREDELELALQDLTRTIREINDLTSEIQEINGTLADRRRSLEDIETTSSLASASRIVVREPPRIADSASMPKLFMMVPLGMMVVTGLVGGVIFAAEFLDQRVKGASDIATMPRTRILGTIPLASEDPTVKSSFETLFRDAEKSVVAESFRQIRTGFLKQMDTSGHTSCVVVSCMPGSGSTSMVTNLGLACAGVDRKVLVLDANFRRSAIHRVLGLKEGPGLGDVLAGVCDFEQAIQSIDGSSMHAMTAGSPEYRVFERLGTQPMTELLAKLGTLYDFVFLDSPPAVVSGDAMALAQRCDASILVTRALAEKRGMVARIKNELTDAPADIQGVIINAVRSAAGGYMKRNIRTSTDYHGPGKKNPMNAGNQSKAGGDDTAKERGAA